MRLNPKGETRNFRFATRESHSGLYHSMKVMRSIPFPSDGFFLRTENFYNVASEIDRLAESGLAGINGYQAFLERNYGGRSLHEQSHSESFAQGTNVRIERIVSDGQVSGWYGQEESEFVALLLGTA